MGQVPSLAVVQSSRRRRLPPSGLVASRLFALWVEGPTRRSTDLSFWAPPAWRTHFRRVEPGTRTAPILGHRVVRVRRYPARFLKFCCRHGGEPHLRASSACDRTDPTERSRSRPGRRWGRRHAALRNPGRAGRAFVGPPNRSASIEPISSVPTSILSRAVWAGRSSRSPLQDCSAWCARASLSPLDFRLVVKEEPAASSTS